MDVLPSEKIKALLLPVVHNEKLVNLLCEQKDPWQKIKIKSKGVKWKTPVMALCIAPP